MIVNGETLLYAAPIKNMLEEKVSHGGVTHGLSEAGYDICIKQRVVFGRLCDKRVVYVMDNMEGHTTPGRFALASAVEEFQMPGNLVGVVHDKSSWARRGLSVFNTVIESGWCGFLTLELVYHGEEDLVIPAGSGIAQVIFHSTSDTALYKGRYQNQPNRPTPAISTE
jgi:dCTP deaminase